MAALAFWQGGFTFYASVVVHVGQEEIGHTRQGFITRQVTNYLNLSGAVALLILAWDTAVSGTLRRARWFAWLGMLLALVLLAGLHVRMDELLDAVERRVVDPSPFLLYHATYLWISTVQWICALSFILLTVFAWRREDAGAKNVPPLTPPASPSHRSRQPTGQR
jgi:hypothetical protein